MKDHGAVNGGAYPVRDITPPLFMRTMHDFFEAWAGILTPTEYLVFHSVLRFAHVESWVSNGFWSVATAARVTRLNPKTIRAALSALRQHGIVIVVSHPGKPPELHIRQDVKPPEGSVRPRPNNTKNLSRPLPTVGSTPLPTVGRGPLPTVGSTPLPTVGRGPLPTVGSTPLPTVGTPSYTPRDPRDLETRKPDDDDRGPTPSSIISDFSEWGLIVDQQEAERTSKGLRDCRPDITREDIREMVADVLPRLTNRKLTRDLASYLRVCLMNHAKGISFDLYRKRALETEARSRKKAEAAAALQREYEALERDQVARDAARQANRPATT